MLRSCIDHCYTDVPEKLSEPIVESAGESDHLAIVVTKYTKAPVSKPQTVRKRHYKNFCIESFLTDINNSDINKSVTSKDNIEDAAQEFEEKFSEILNFHAPMKTFQMRKNYSPHISTETKFLIDERKALQEEAVKSGNQTLLNEFKLKAKEVKKSAKIDYINHNEKNMSDNDDNHHGSISGHSIATADMKKPANRANLVREHLYKKVWTFCQNSNKLATIIHLLSK